MEFKSPDDDEVGTTTTTTSSSSLVYNPVSAFSKPTLSPSSSLLPRNGLYFPPSQPLNPTILPADHNHINSPFSSSPAEAIHGIKTPPSNPNSMSNDACYKYKECLRNHAANIGVHVVDGCCEFMPDLEPSSMNCAACGCHRNFHRKEPLTANAASTFKPSLPRPQAHHHSVLQQARPFQLTGFAQAPTASFHGASEVFNFGGGNTSGSVGTTTTESSSEEKMNGGTPKTSTGSRKRFRTKFSQEQKERMLGFAEKIGWRIRREDEGMIEQFCNEVGVGRQVLKVWMHNNKHIVRRQHNSDQNQVNSMSMTMGQLNQQQQ